jgi:organic hydroperoxide reductase OsmC/OhrA
MTQVARYGHMLKVTVGTMRMRVTARYRVDGSVLNDSVRGQMVGAETTLELESPDPPDRIARVVRNAEHGCFVLQALLNPVPITTTTKLNGTALGGS